ncbi:type III secretion protein [Pseudomonas syringae]|uniref:Type III secretion protein n=1 Tax=Pseudomonas syringae TaxID=317 RepID=A0A244EQZ6_PSESX|nr:type III secretion protein [Pseudomonas syringae]OUM06941.1 type III secretion protein [Pseudomonas syringae]
MEFSDFTEILGQWAEQRPATPLDCWIDDANARLAAEVNGVRCSIDLLDPCDAADPQRLEALLSEGGASLACCCDGALAIDPQTRCLVLVSWIPDPCSLNELLNRLESLANQRAALLSLMQTSIRNTALTVYGRANLNNRQPGV